MGEENIISKKKFKNKKKIKKIIIIKGKSGIITILGMNRMSYATLWTNNLGARGGVAVVSFSMVVPD